MEALLKPRIGCARRHRNRWSLLAPALLAIACATLPYKAPAAEKLPDIETIRAAVDFYAQSIKTLQGKYVLRKSRPPGSALTPATMRDHRAETDFRADITNGKIYLDERESYYLPGRKGEELRFELHEIMQSDGARSAALVHTHVASPVESKVPPGIPMWLNFAPRDEIANRYVAWDLAGLRRRENGTLVSILRNAAARVEGTDEVNGAKCIRVRVAPEGGHPVVAWLDAAHAFLPRRIECWRVGAEPNMLHQFDVYEFRKFPGSASGTELWFPIKGRARSWIGVIEDIEIVELKINLPIEPAALAIQTEQLPDGVKVNDFSGAGRGNYYTGGSKDLWDERKRLYDEEHERLKLLMDPPNSPPQAQFSGAGSVPTPVVAAGNSNHVHWGIWLLGAASLALLVTGGISVLRARR